MENNKEIKNTIEELQPISLSDVKEEDMGSEFDQQAMVNDQIESEQIHEILITLDNEQLKKIVTDNSAVSLAEALSYLDNEDIRRFYSFKTIDLDKFGEIFSYLKVEQRVYLITQLNKKELALLLKYVSNDDLADLLDDVKRLVRDKILLALPTKRRSIIYQLSKFSDDTVGSIMTTEYLSVLPYLTVKEILNKVKQIGNTLETVRTIFIVDPYNKLLGIKRLEDLMFEDENAKISTIMIKDFAYIGPTANKEEAIPICKEYDLPTLPVISNKGEMLGILTFDDVMDVIDESITDDLLRQGGVINNEKPYMENKVFNIAKSYFIWLIIILVINTLTGIIMSRFDRALMTLPILVSFIPALNDSCGNSASQTASMVIRTISTERLDKKGYLKIISKETLTGLLSGLVVAIFNFAWVILELNFLLGVTPEMKKIMEEDLFIQDPQIGYLIISAIVSTALFIAIFFSKTFASILPILAKKMKLDPAVMSGPIVTSLMDIITLLLYFTIAILVIGNINPNLFAV